MILIGTTWSSKFMWPTSPVQEGEQVGMRPTWDKVSSGATLEHNIDNPVSLGEYLSSDAFLPSCFGEVKQVDRVGERKSVCVCSTLPSRPRNDNCRIHSSSQGGTPQPWPAFYSTLFPNLRREMFVRYTKQF